MTHLETDPLRILIANEREDHLALVAPIVAVAAVPIWKGS
jgi:hypothetical protein